VRWRRVLLAGAIALASIAAAQAHQINLSTARVTLGGDRGVSVEVGLKGSDADRLAGTRIFDAQRDQVDPALVAASAAAITAYVTAHIALTGADGRACVPGTAALMPDGDGVIFRNRFSCRDVGGDIVYRSTVMTDTDPAARQVVLIGEGDNAPQALLDAANTAVTLSAPSPSLLSTLERYLVTGIEHIFLGYDHIAFLVAVVLWARRLVPVIKIVTAFTIAHSITLSLATLNVVVIPGTIVEPAIAASIVYVAMENFFTRNIDGRWRVAFVFGLIHGFGFAGALLDEFDFDVVAGFEQVLLLDRLSFDTESLVSETSRGEGRRVCPTAHPQIDLARRGAQLRVQGPYERSIPTTPIQPVDLNWRQTSFWGQAE